MGVPYQFAGREGRQPASLLDADFDYLWGLLVNRGLDITTLPTGAVTDWAPYIEDAAALVTDSASEFYLKPIFFPAQNYPVGRTIQIQDVEEVDFQLAPNARIVAAAGLQGKIFRFIDATKFSFVGGIIDASAMGNPGPGQAWDSLSVESNSEQSSDVTIQGVQFIHSDGSGPGGGDSSIFGAWTTRMRIEGCTFVGSYDTAVYLSGNGVTSDTSYDYIVTDNFFLSCYSACEAKRTAKVVAFTNNIVRNSGTAGFATSPGDNPGTPPQLPGGRVICSDNEFIDTYNDAIVLHGDGWNVVEGNRIEGFTDTSTFVWRGIVVAGSIKNKVRGNLIKAVGGTGHTNQRGIYLVPYTLNTVVNNSTDNDVSGNTVEGLEFGIIEEDSSQNRNVYDQNIFIGCTTNYRLLGAASWATGISRAWTPVAHSLTTVGSVAVTGTYSRVGNIVRFLIKIVGSGGGTSASTSNTTNFTGLPFAVDEYSTCQAVSAVSNASFGIGQIFPDGGTGAPYTPTWAANGNVVVTGQYMTTG